MEAYQQRLSDHHEVASAIAIMAAVLMLLAGLVPRIGRLPVIGQGVALGGVLTLLYGIVLAVQTQSELLRFVAVAVGLAALLVSIYIKFRPGRTSVARSVVTNLPALPQRRSGPLALRGARLVLSRVG